LEAAIISLIYLPRATAIRIVEYGPLPAMLVCSAGRVEWSVRADGTKSLGPREPDPETYAYDVLNGQEGEASGDVKASAWFDHPIAKRFPLHEHSIRAYQGVVLSLLWWRDEHMLMELDDYEERKTHP
jgi:hypothetical protein